MAVVQDFAADNLTFTINLVNLFGEGDVEMEQLDIETVKDSDLAELIDNFTQNNNTIAQNPNPATQQQDAASAEETEKSNRFPDPTDKEIDDIANANIRKKTRKQTICGIKMFRGK